jgi:hypothetical protein
VIHSQQTATGCWATVRAGKADAESNLIGEYRSRDEVVFSDGTRVPYNESRTATADGLTIKRGRSTITITWSGTRPASLSTSTRTYLRDQRRRVHVVRIPHDGTLATTIRCY